MLNNNFITIAQFDEIGRDQRGVTAGFKLPRKQDDFIYITRNAGSLSGGTYHEGLNEGTNPKTFVLISGEIEFVYRVTTENERHSVNVQAPALIQVKPYVIHSVKAITDIIILECNSIADIQNDRFKEAL